MIQSSTFSAPALETMNGLMPAFEFTALIISDDQRAVYAARQRSLDRDVAVKILSPEVSESPKFRRSFEVTARTMAKLNHPNLIGVFDSGHVRDMLYFVMEFIPGKSLQRSARGHCVELSQTLLLIEGISSGLAHAHAHGIVHGAVEPSVILLNQKAEPKIGNFGFSYSAHTEAGRENPYIAPEVRIGYAEPGHRSDLYAVGAILYELLTGTPQRVGCPAPSTLSKCGPKLDAVWQKATHPDPTQRFSSMGDFNKEISNLIKGPDDTAAVTPAKQASDARGVPPARVPKSKGTPISWSAQDGGINWTLIRNILFNAALIYAIYLAWGHYKARKTEVERINREILAINANRGKQTTDGGKNEEPKNFSTSPTPVPRPVRPDPVAPKSETPKASLQRLATALAAGIRSEMPVGSVQKGESIYFLVDESMTWTEASRFAEQHGAHLVIPSVGADLTWLVNNVTQKKAVWIGVAKSGASNWVLADGRPWKLSKEPGGSGPYVGIDKDGYLRAAGAKVSLPFVIQWHRDGKNPGALDALLAVTRESLGKSAPIFPPGTRTFDKRNFLVVIRPVDWREAVNLSEKSGGHLAVPTNSAEMAAMEEMIKDFSIGRGIWLGASLKGSQWTWITGEPWKTAHWANDAETETPNTGLIIQSGKSWSSRGVSESASGFIIEWSDDAKSKPTVSAETRVTPPPPVLSADEIEALSRKAKELITAADRKRTDQLAGNIRKFSADLDAYLRNLPVGVKAGLQSSVDELKASVVQSRIPATILDSGEKLNTGIEGITKYGIRKQNEIDAEFLANSGKIHAAFLIKVRGAASQAQKAGQTALAKSLNDILNQAEKLEPWIQSLGVEAKPAPPEPEVGGDPDPEPDGMRKNDSENNGSGENPSPPPNNDGGGGLIE